jgi:GT2 family glycosyltransferase
VSERGSPEPASLRSDRGPDLSAILATPDDLETIRTTVRRLSAQSVADRIELVVVAPSGAALEPFRAELAPFHGVQLVELESVPSIAPANAAGVRRARAPVVVLCEDHAWPEAGWAEALLRAHGGPYAAVGPVVRNANPRSAVSAADFLMGYGPWAERSARREVDHLPGHNSSYKRDVLLAYGGRLEAFLEAETVLHWDLRRRGERLLLEPAARLAHLNFSRWGTFLRVQMLAGRVFAARRAAGFGAARRAAFVLLAPLVPAVRLFRLLRGTRVRLLARAFPALLPGLLLDGLGQLLGYLAGAGRAPEALARFEFHRARHVRPGEAAGDGAR